MRRIWVASLSADVQALAPDEARHAQGVLRLAAGEPLVLFDGEGRERDATLESASKRGVRVRATGPVRVAPAAAGPAVTLIVSLLKGEAMDRVVRGATELGAVRIVPVVAARSVARGGDKAERWRRIAREAARQSGRAVVPRVDEVGTLAEARTGEGTRVLLWEGEKRRPLADVDAAVVTLAVGPEGGWTAEELAAFDGVGFERRGMSDAILRAETASLAAVAVVRRLAR